jgi:acyl-CoA synthetase (AMP-forming)/AMP-acid ligase II
MTVYSGGPRPDVPDIDVTSFVLRRAADLGERPAIVEAASGRTVSYAELEAGVRRFRVGVAARGLGRGDTLCVALPNVAEFVIAFHGAASAGLRCTTANPLYTARELEHQLHDTGAKVAVAGSANAEAVLEAAATTGCDVYVLGGHERAAPFDSLLGDDDADDTVKVESLSDIAAVLYSGGTTGLPKGVLLSHRNLVVSIVQSEATLALTPDDVVIAALPFFHVYGLNVILNRALAAGATVVAMQRFALDEFLALIEQHRVTRAYIVPAMAVAIANDPIVDRYDLSSLRNVLSAAAILNADLAEACERKLGCPVTQGYGMTEMSSISHLAPLFDAPRKPESIGLPVPGTECRLVDADTGEDAAPGEAGELYLRGEHVMAGYLNNPEATAATVDREGWLHTGDLAVVDDDGWFRVVARLKEIIKYKGYQVAPAELEALLLEHPHVGDCAVVGRPDDEAGEIPVAYIVASGEHVDEADVMRYVADRVAPYKRIRRIEMIDQIPKSASGRILRRLLEASP